MGDPSHILTEREAVRLAERVLLRSRVSAGNAACVAEALVAAELDGLGSHGLSRLPAYADQAIAGKVDGFAVPEVTHPARAVVRVDAKDGFAFPAIRAGLESAAERAGECGIVAISVARSHHCGVAGHHAYATNLRLFAMGLSIVFGIVSYLWDVNRRRVGLRLPQTHPIENGKHGERAP